MVNTDYYWRKAMECTQRAEDTMDEEVRTFFYRLRDAWIAAGNRAEMIEDLNVHVPMRAGSENLMTGTLH
jgi:hypothetical protein